MGNKVNLDITAGIARLIMLDGDQGNVIDLELATELREALADIRRQQGVRALLLGSRGRNFCFGGSLTAMNAQSDLSDYARRVTVTYHDFLTSMVGLDMPIINAVQGAAAGAGVALATLGDYVIARDDAHFTMAFTAIAFSPDGGSTYFLPKLVGLRRFQEMVFTNRRIRAEEAQAIGLVTEVAAGDAFEARVDAVVEQFARAPTGALAATRRLLFASATNDLQAQLDLESRTLAAQCRSPDVTEGVAAMLAKRPAEFTGQ